jgi:response regulator of citrate/malate metabolism
MKRSILLVEDDLWLGDMYFQELKDHQVLRAATAEQALELIENNSISLIVLDVFLPDHNGLELIHEIASYQDSMNIPIIILSAVSEQDFGLSKKRMSHYGIVDYLYKPESKPSYVAEKVKYHLNTFVG